MLSLRPLNPKEWGDTRFVHNVRSHPEVSKWLHGPVLSGGESWIRKNVDHIERSIFILELEEDPIGYAQLTKQGDELELGWALHPDYQGKGLGRQAVWAWMAYASGRPERTLALTVRPENERAIKLYDEAGFTGDEGNDQRWRLSRDNDVQTAVLTYVGHAGFQVEYDGVRLLCDPWFNSAFYGSWTPHPPNAHVLSHLDPPNHVYISHAHEDHFDRAFLTSLSRETHVIVPHWLVKNLRELGFKNVYGLSDTDEMGLSDTGGTEMKIQLFCDERKRDSALLIEVNGKRILNLNDCHLPIEKLPKADVLFCQFSGAFHYPHSYDFPPELMHDKVHDVRERYIHQLIETAKATGAQLYVPSAGPPWLSDPKLNRSESIFYRWHSIAERFQECIASEMNPGDELLLGDHVAWIRRPKWFLDLRLKQQLRHELPAYFSRLNWKHRSLLTERPKSFYLDVGSEGFLVYMNGDEGVVFNRKEVADPRANYTIRVRPEMMADIIKGGRWDAAFLSNKIKLHRDRDVYDAELFQILYNDRPEDPQLEFDACPEMVDRGDGISHQRYCPHQGQDLSFAPMAVDHDGKRVLVQCPRHGWKWDLKTGECIQGGAQPICVKGPP